jgi:hypothetical protein
VEILSTINNLSAAALAKEDLDAVASSVGGSTINLSRCSRNSRHKRVKILSTINSQLSTAAMLQRDSFEESTRLAKLIGEVPLPRSTGKVE